MIARWIARLTRTRLPLRASECERVMVERYGRHCANPREHLLRASAR